MEAFEERAQKKQPPPVTTAQSIHVLPYASALAGMVVRERACEDLKLDADEAFEQGRRIEAMLQGREQLGIAKYGTPLHTHNGRSADVDLREELLDAVMYGTALLLEWPEGAPHDGYISEDTCLAFAALEGVMQSISRRLRAPPRARQE